MHPGKRKALNKDNEADALIDKAEKPKAGIRAKLEHPFRVIKQSVWICEGALPRSEEKHGTAGNAVCLVQLADGAQQIDGGTGMGAPANRVGALKSPQTAHLGLCVQCRTRSPP